MILFLLACTDTPIEPQPAETAPPPRKALVIGVDGARPDAIATAMTPNLDSLAACSDTATTQLTGPTLSGPGWTSILTGVESEKHNIFGNGDYDAIDRAYPTMVQRAVDAGHPTAMSVHWPDVVHGITEPGAPSVADLGTDAGVTEAMVNHINTGSYDLHFVHLDDVDGAGHASGFSKETPAYISAIEEIDRLVGLVVTSVRERENEEWLIVATTDHGGRGTSHGPMDVDNQTIWFCVDGKGDVDLAGASHLDTSPTVLTWLGIDPGETDGTAR